MADYTEDAKAALASIKEAGKEYVISRSSPVFDDISGTPTGATEASGKIAAIILPRYKGQVFDALDSSMKEALVRGKLKTCLAAAQGAPFEPAALDEITIGSETWQVIGCSTLGPDGLPILYTIGIVLK